jgi:hypothetical protein
MNPSIFIWLADAFPAHLVAYLVVSAIGVKPNILAHPVSDLRLLFAIVATFLLPRLPVFPLSQLRPGDAPS